LKKTAFTMIELIFVIVVIGIIAAMIIPRLDRDNRFEAATQVLNHIKYTQHLAMTQDVYNDQNPLWFLARWEIEFYGCGGYSIHSNANLTPAAPNAANNEAALDPQTRKRLWSPANCAMPMAAGDYEKMNLAGFYDVNNIATSAGCAGASISFDTLGRPYGAVAMHGVTKANCNITLGFNVGANEVIRIHPETGYACILDAAGANCL